MALSISRLRRFFIGALVFVCAAVACSYLYLRHRVENALREVPKKLEIQVQQSANGFTISKSDQGRTLFKVQASKAVQFKAGHTQLHKVTITIYGQDSSRFDQVYGENFDYDQNTGDVTGRGDVSIDLQANPRGLESPDQAPPRELKNPIHLRTTNLIFNQKAGDGRTSEVVEFSVPQASGSARGARYTASTGQLLLESQVNITVHGPKPATIVAQQAVLEKNPREILLRRPQAHNSEQQAQARSATLYLRDDNTLQRATASGDVELVSRGQRKTGAQVTRVSAQDLQIDLADGNQIEHALLSREVKFESEAPQRSETTAGRALLSFGAKNILTKIHAEDQVQMVQHPAPGTKGGQEIEVTAPAMDYFIADGRRFTRAETFGSPQISLLPVENKQSPTRITAGKFLANFDPLGQLTQVHGGPQARVVSGGPPGANTPQPDRVSTSDSITAEFRPGIGLQNVIQAGHFVYTAGTQKAFSERAQFTPADQIVALSGSPRILDGGMETTANSVRLNRGTGEGFAQGDVKTTYSDLKPQPNGALLAASDPIHVTAQSMIARSSPEIATYTGNVRLWQNANLIEAPWMQFEKEARTLTAHSMGNENVSTFLVQAGQNAKVMPVQTTADRLIYIDSQRKAHFSGNVVVHGSDMTVTANEMDVFLAPASSHNQNSASVSTQTPAQLEKIVALGSVVLTQPNRRGTGDKLVYTATDDKFVLTGGPPSIFDAEQGKITGVSLTLYRTDDRVIVEGDTSSPAVTKTKVVR